MKFYDSDPSLESLLRNVPLREPGEALDERIEKTFAQYRFRHPRRTLYRRLALAASLLIAIGIGHFIVQRKTNPVAIIPPPLDNTIQIERDSSTIIDDGIIARGDAAYQRYRRRTVREIWTIDSKTHAQTCMTIPTEQIVIQKMEAF